MFVGLHRAIWMVLVEFSRTRIAQTDAANNSTPLSREEYRQLKAANAQVSNVKFGRELTTRALAYSTAVSAPHDTAVASSGNPPAACPATTGGFPSSSPSADNTAVSWAMRNAMRDLAQRQQRGGMGGRVILPTDIDNTRPDQLRAISLVQPTPAIETASTATFEPSAQTAVYPAAAVAFLAHDLVSVGRVFHLLKHYDAKHSGRGYLPVGTVYSLAEEMGVGERRLRMILAEGDGRAWDRYKSGRHVYLRLYSPEAVCRALGVDYSRRRVYLPLSAFFEAKRRGQQVTAVKHTAAHFYACTFHLTGKSGVISRETLETMTGVCEETQRHYEYLLGVQSKRNYRPTYEKVDQENAWEYGGRRNLSIFVYHDYSKRARKHKPGGERYLVILEPNSYTRPFETASKGRRYRRSLASKDRRGTRPNTIFYLNARQAAKKATRQPSHDVLVRGDTIKGAVLWPCMHSIS